MANRTLSMRNLAGAVASFLLVVAVFDFAAFCRRAAALTPEANPRGDAIVALTGGSGRRIAAGADLVRQGAGARLLISGVHPDVDIDAIKALTGGDGAVYACCVDIGREAETTVGNGVETARWAAHHGYQSLIVVTSDYHMPRSLIEFRRVMPEVALTAHPVRTVIDPAKVWRDPKSFRGLVTEWAKWRITVARRGADG